VEEKRLWEIEKFIPLFCPKCNRKFFKQDEDFVLFFGDIIKEDRIPRRTSGYDIIICNHCGNYTARVWLQVRTVETVEEAELLIEQEGFTNPHQVTGYGIHARPRTRIFNKKIVCPLIIHSHWPPDEDDFGNHTAS
jgi:hypothetical protein